MACHKLTALALAMALGGSGQEGSGQGESGQGGSGQGESHDESQHKNDLCKGMAEPDPESCPISCIISDPMCGEDGYTYYCGCQDAMCSGTRIVHSGECE
ncbi:hypothetical protein LINGRAHAP2_LOCUS16034 [Linum grandiflorum]